MCGHPVSKGGAAFQLGMFPGATAKSRLKTIFAGFQTAIMRTFFRFAFATATLITSLSFLSAQDLAPRAYTITPLRSNAITLTYSFFDGSLLFDGAVPITGATARTSMPVFSYYHSFNFFGRSANIVAFLPYGVGHFRGTALGAERLAYRSGLLDSAYRFSVNLKGGPALLPSDFRKWHQKRLIGASLRMVAPTGQYDPTKLINWGNNRWAFKSELGYSERRGNWLLDVYGGVWFYTKNAEFFSRNDYFPGTRAQTQEPIGSVEVHLSYDVKPRLWASLDGNFWYGGRTSLNDVENPVTRQRNSRIGLTGSIPVSRHHSLKLSWSTGSYIKFGGNYANLSVGWQYSWLGRPN
jgi:Putative MetA-pathway of phenol degradation